jgi:iron(III) transport system permease protein
LSVAMAVMLAWSARRGGWCAVPAALVAALGFSLMGPLIGLALVWLFTLHDTAWLEWCYSRTISAPVLAAAVRAVPLPVLICWVAFGTLNGETIDAAALDGAGPLARCLRIGVGQRRNAVMLAWLVAFVVACGELSATILATPPGLETVPIRVFGLIHAGVDNQVAAVCLTSVVALAAMAALLSIAKPGRWLWGRAR